MENPEKRVTFRHKQLLTWLMGNRSKVVGAAISICRAWADCGMLKGTHHKASYEEYSAILGGILDLAGISGFLENDAELERASGGERDLWRAFIEHWFRKFGEVPITTKSLILLAEENDLLYEMLGPSTGDRGMSTSMGKALASKVGVVLNIETPTGKRSASIRKSTMQTGYNRFRLEIPGGDDMPSPPPTPPL